MQLNRSTDITLLQGERSHFGRQSSYLKFSRFETKRQIIGQDAVQVERKLPFLRNITKKNRPWMLSVFL